MATTPQRDEGQEFAEAERDLVAALFLHSPDALWVERRHVRLLEALGMSVPLWRKALVFKTVTDLLTDITTKRTTVQHAPTKMAYVDRFPKKSKPTPTFRNGKNVWYVTYECRSPSCGMRTSRLSNTTRGRDVWCNGVEQIAKKRTAEESKTSG